MELAHRPGVTNSGCISENTNAWEVFCRVLIDALSGLTPSHGDTGAVVDSCIGTIGEGSRVSSMVLVEGTVPRSSETYVKLFSHEYHSREAQLNGRTCVFRVAAR